MLQQLEWSALGGFGCGFLVCLCLGRRARYVPLGAIVGAVVLSHQGPWWMALLAGISGHLAGIIVLDRRAGEPAPAYARSGFVMTIAVLGFASIGSLHYAANEAMNAVDRSDYANWKTIAAESKAGQFVEMHYRPCVAFKSQTVVAYWSMEIVTQREDLTVCADAVVERARQAGGDVFAKSVSDVIEDLPKRLALSPDAEAALNRIAGAPAGDADKVRTSTVDMHAPECTLTGPDGKPWNLQEGANAPVVLPAGSTISQACFVNDRGDAAARK